MMLAKIMSSKAPPTIMSDPKPVSIVSRSPTCGSVLAI